MPGGGAGVVDEADQQPGRDQVKKVNIMDTFTQSHNQITNNFFSFVAGKGQRCC